MENKRKEIINTVEALVSGFLYFDRKEDEDLEIGEIEKAIENDIISINEIVQCFSNELRTKLYINKRS